MHIMLLKGCYQLTSLTLFVCQGASKPAPEACQVKQDAAALAAAETLLTNCRTFAC